MNSLKDVYVVSSTQPSAKAFANEEFIIKNMDMNMTICWWYMPYSDETGTDTLFSIATEGDHISTHYNVCLRLNMNILKFPSIHLTYRPKLVRSMK